MSTNLRIGSLFSGIGGLELGFEWAGVGRTVWQIEASPFCRAVLAIHWPNARRFDDVRTVDASTLSPVDLLCGGFPCQNLSSANVRTRDGLNGEKSGLWTHFDRLIGELRPVWVVVENVGAVWDRWVPSVRRALWTRGYASVCLRLSTADVGAPHHRDRAFVVAHADRESQRLRAVHEALASVRTDAGRARGPWRDPFAGPVRLVDGLSGGMDAVRAYGNAVSPQVGWLVGRALLALS